MFENTYENNSNFEIKVSYSVFDRSTNLSYFKIFMNIKI